MLRFAPGAYDADIRLRLEALQRLLAVPCGRHCVRTRLPAAWLLAASALLKKRLEQAVTGRIRCDSAGVLLAYAYPDRIAQRKTGFDYVLAGGRGAFFPET